MPPSIPRWLGRCVFALLLCTFTALTAAQPADQPVSTPAAVQEFSGAVALQNRGEYDLAADAWSDFLQKWAGDPLAPKARHYRGVCRFQLQKYAEARADFEQVVKNSPNIDLIESTYVNLGLSLFNLAQGGGQTTAGDGGNGGGVGPTYDQAIATFKTQLERFADGEFAPLAWYYQAEALYARQKRPEAIAAYRQFVAEYPDHKLRPDALYGLGVAQADTGAAAAAVKSFEVFRTSFAKHPLATEVTMRLGDALFAQGKQAAAESHFAAAAKVEGFAHADYALLRRAACRFETGDFPAAAEQYMALVQEYPKSPHVAVAALNAGKALLRTGRPGDAIEWFQNARAAGGTHAIEAAHWLARSFLTVNKPADALVTAETTLATPLPKAWQIPFALDRADALFAIPERRQEAIKAYTQIADDHPSNPQAGQALYLAADTALAVGDYQQALVLVTRYLKDYSNHTALAQVRHIEAEAQLQLKQYSVAAAGFQTLLDSFPENENHAAWRNRLALTLSLAGKHQEVIDRLAPSLEKIEDAAIRAEAELHVGTAFLAQKQFNRALPLLQAAVDRAGAAGAAALIERVLLQLARAQHGLGDTTAAIASVERLLSDYPKGRLAAEARLRLADFFAAAGNDAKAAEVYQQVLAAGADGPLVPPAMFGAAGACSRTGDYPKAVELLDRFITRFADHRLAPDAHFARAVARQKTKNEAGAIEDVAAFLAARPDDPRKFDALYVRGLCEASQQRFADAIKTYETILVDLPEYAAADRVLYEMAWVQRESGETAAAVKTFERLTAEHANSPLAAECHYRVGEARYAAKDYAAAVGSYAAARDKAGAGELAEKARHKLAWSLYQQGQYDAAEKEFAAQLAAVPGGPLAADAKVMHGEALFKQGKFAAALTALQDATKTEPSSDLFRVIALLHAGQAAGQLKKWDESLKLLEQCARVFPASDYRDEVEYERGWALHQLGRDDDALPRFQQVSSRNSTALGARSRFMVGEIQMAKQEYAAAVRTLFEVAYGYKNIGQEADVWKASAMFDAARCLEQLKKQPSAIKVYRELVERFPQSDKVEHAKSRLRELVP